MEIKIYSTPECPFCKAAKKFFQERSIAYKDIDVSQDEDAAQEMINKSGQMGVPVIEIGKEIIVGFDKERIEKVLEANKFKQKEEKQKDSKKKTEEQIYDSIIIGGGPAGITSAIYLARRKLKILLLYLELGGQASITSAIENYAGFRFITGKEFSQRLDEHIKEYNVLCKKEKVLEIKNVKKVFEVKTENNVYYGKTVIIASGGRQRELGIEGEKEFLNKGVAYCATCDAPIFKNKDVAIIGGGNSALEAALALEKYAKKIYIVTINEKLEGENVLIEKVKSIKNIEIILSSETKKIEGNRFVEKIIIENKDGKKEIPVQGVFIEIGYIPNSDFVNVRKNKKNEIIVNSNNETSKKGIFAAGDVTNIPVKQIIVAAGEGAKAAMSVASYLSKRKNSI